MQELEVITVDPYEVSRFQDIKFVHHYQWKDKLYKAGDYFMSLGDLDPKEDAQLFEMWSDLDEYLQYTMQEVLEESAKLEEDHETYRLQFRKQAEKMLKQIKANPKNPTPYYLLMQAKSMELRQKAHAAVLVARSQVGNYLKPAIVFLLQAKLRTNLPLFLAEMEDGNGNRAAVAHVWNLPQTQDAEGKKSFNKDLCNPDCLRDFREGLYKMLPPEEFNELCTKHAPKESLIKTYTEDDEAQTLGQLKSLIVPD